MCFKIHVNDNMYILFHKISSLLHCHELTLHKDYFTHGYIMLHIGTTHSF